MKARSFFLKAYLIATALALGAAVPALAWAQLQQLGPNATTQDFIHGLTPDADDSGIKFKGLRVLNAPPDGAGPEGAAAVAVDIRFALNSAVLSDQAKATVARMAAAMNSPQLAAYRFRLEGHTDVTGRPEYNLALSQKRAESVRAFLIEKFSVAAARLEAVGRGETELLDPGDPASPVNRRVKIVNLGR
jgi:outer membrane protein OmpA-like peptidoglycan-associated protein